MIFSLELAFCHLDDLSYKLNLTLILFLKITYALWKLDKLICGHLLKV